MPKLFIVRHGEAAAGWTEDPDPGLSIRGRDQARGLADAFVNRLGRPMPVLTSPMRRTRETADALASRWGIGADVEPAVGEVPSPMQTPLGERGTWLRGLMDATWSDVPHDLRIWRDGVVDTVTGLAHDAVIVSHFIAINAVVGAAEGDDRVVSFHPGYCSVTVIEHDGAALSVLERGAQASTLVL